MSFISKKIAALHLNQQFLKGSIWSFLLQIALALLTLLTSLFIARWAGDSHFGAYSVVSNWVLLLAMLALAGVDDLLIKQIPIYQQADNHLFIKKIFVWAWAYSTIFFLLISLIFIFLLEFNCLSNWKNNRFLFYLGLLILFFYCQLSIFQSVFRGFQLMKMGQLGEKFIQPLSFFICLFVFLNCFELTDFWAIFFRLISFILAAFIILFFLYKKYNFLFAKTQLSTNIILQAQLSSEQKKWKTTAFYFMLMSFLYAANSRADLVLLDLFQIDFAQIAHYNAAARFADLLNLPFMVVATVASPMFSDFYNSKNFTKLQTFFTQITFIAFFLTAIGFILFYFLGEWLLSWFGTSFITAYDILILLSISKLLHSFFGASNYLLMMCGQEKKAIISVIISVLVNIILQILLIPHFGISATAWANLISLFIFELIQAYILITYAHIKPTALAFLYKF